MKQKLFDYLSKEHNLILLDNELDEIIRIVNSSKEILNSELHKANVVRQSEQLCYCGKSENKAFSPCCSLTCCGKQFE